MTREQLAKTDAKKVRSNADLFALFKKYVTEDAGLIYSNGKLPQGCFGCQFNSLFSRWKNIYLTPKKNTKMANSTKTYELKNKATKFYFKGSVLSSKSSDQEWLDWINHPADADKIAKRKSYFSKLPNSGNQEPAAPKKAKATPKKKVETEKTEEETPETDQ